MNKYDIINNIIVNLDRVQVQGIAAMNALVNTVRDLNTLAQMLQQEDEAKAKENGGEDHQGEKEQTEHSEPIKLDAKITPINDPQEGE